MIKQQRLAGIDLGRGIAIFAVILVHADEGLSSIPKIWEFCLNFADFAVPFFLATSFWLAVGKIHLRHQAGWLKPRITKLALSYLIWSLIYLVYKIGKYTLAGESDRWQRLISDPIAIVFEGNAAFHLYFLPLLISGTIMLCFLPLRLLLSPRLKLIVAAIVVAMAIELLVPEVDATTGRSAIVEALWTWFSWGIRCLPYIAVAMLLHHPRLKLYLAHPSQLKTHAWLAVFVGVNSISLANLDSVQELLRGYSALMLAIFVSQYRFCVHPLIINLSKCSFGIYLIHLIWIESGQIVEARLLSEPWRVSTPNLLLFTTVCFCLSWLTVDILMRRRHLAQIIFST